MSKFQKFLKGAWIYSFLVEICIILFLVHCFFNGASFFFSSYSGFDAVVVGLISLAMTWVFWVPVLLFQIAMSIIMHIKPEYKQISVNEYFKNIKFYIPLILIIGVLLISKIDYSDNPPRVYSSTEEMSNAMKEGFCKSLYNTDIEDDYAKVVDYNELNNVLSSINESADLDKSDKYVLVVSHKIKGEMKNVRCIKSERSGDEPLELHLKHTLDDSNSNESITLIYFKLPDNVKLDSDEIKCIWHME